MSKLRALMLITAFLLGTACSSSSPVTQPSSNSSGQAPSPTPVGVSLVQWAVKPTTTNLSAGSVTFSVKDDGTIPHEFVVLKTDTKASRIHVGTFEGEPDRINEDIAGTNVGETGDLQPGTSKSLTLDLKPGHYVFLCNLPAHYASGMHVDVTVS